jgi:RNA polymerase sigma factor FliA
MTYQPTSSEFSMISAEAAVPLTYDRAGQTKRDTELLVRKHLPMVRRVAWHVHGSMSTIVDIEDLVQIGLVALVEAANVFEDRGQVTFEQYLRTRLRGAMIDELRRQATITRGAMRRRRTYQDAIKSLTLEHERAPSEGEVAARIGVPVDKLRAEYSTAEAVRFDSLDEVYSDEGPWFMSNEPNAFDQLADADQRQALIETIAELPEREQQVIQLYYVEELNLEEIGQVLGVGAARVCQIKKSAHDRLKKGLQRRLG